MSEAREQQRERAEKGREILDQQRAKGEPGQKQPAHQDFRASAEETVKRVEEMQAQFQADTQGPSEERAKQPGNPHPVPPEERKPGPGPMATQAADIAAGALSAAREHLTSQLVTDAKVMSDPRYERDQEVFEAGQTGTLALVPPSEAEAIATAQRSGLSEEVAEALPKTPEEQVEDDRRRLEEGKDRKEQIQGAVVPGQQEGAPRNNLAVAEAAGKKVGGKTTDASNVNENRPSSEEKSHVVK